MAEIFTYHQTFTLQNGATLPRLELGYTILGELNPNSKVVWVFHALTANSDPSLWWDGLVGEGKLFNSSAYTIICVNIPGSCYGSSGPLSVNPVTKEHYLHSFPVFSVVDIVKAFQLLKNFLGIQKIHIGIGASMGGQHLLQWAADEPELFENIIPIACNARQSAWSLAIDAAQRLAIEADTSWKENIITAGINGLKAARALALVHYRTYLGFEEKNISATSNAETYQRYQAQKITERFNAFSYYNLSLSRSTHNVENELKNIFANTLVIGIESDGLFPLLEQEYLTENIPNAKMATIHSKYGHDAFLVETDQLTAIIKKFLSAIAAYHDKTKAA
jgi:homoserine O-acetyltransferase